MMKIDELLKEIEEIVNTASSVPLTGKIMVEGEEIINILNNQLMNTVHDPEKIFNQELVIKQKIEPVFESFRDIITQLNQQNKISLYPELE